MAMRFNQLIYFIFLTAWPLPCVAGSALPVTIASEPSREIISLTLHSSRGAKVFTLSHPSRVVVDISTSGELNEVELPANYKGTLIARVRSGRFDVHTQRIVFELSEPPSSVNTHTQVTRGQTVVNITLGQKRAKSTASSATPSKTTVKEFSKTAKKSIKSREELPLVVIDAGHGGQDPGTTGKHGTREKDVVLAYAQALGKALEAKKRYRVVLTRSTDEFILLRERVNIARQAGGDLFISIHADSAPANLARGLSVYTVSEKASDAEAEALAARENKVDTVYGMDLSAQSEDVADILVSLAQRDTMNKSDRFANQLVVTLEGHGVRLLENTHRFAGFAVLKAPDIPSVLVEIGFLSNPEEETVLNSSAYRTKVVNALAQGIDEYFLARGE